MYEWRKEAISENAKLEEDLTLTIPSVEYPTRSQRQRSRFD